jgi:hypothetical protein
LATQCGISLFVALLVVGNLRQTTTRGEIAKRSGPAAWQRKELFAPLFEQTLEEQVGRRIDVIDLVARLMVHHALARGEQTDDDGAVIGQRLVDELRAVLDSVCVTRQWHTIRTTNRRIISRKLVRTQLTREAYLTARHIWRKKRWCAPHRSALMLVRLPLTGPASLYALRKSVIKSCQNLIVRAPTWCVRVELGCKMQWHVKRRGDDAYNAAESYIAFSLTVRECSITSNFVPSYERCRLQYMPNC